MIAWRAALAGAGLLAIGCAVDPVSSPPPVDAATLFRIASISKLVTTIGALRLVDEGKLSLDADIAGYFGYRVRNPHFPDVPVTLRMLLTHTSSLRDDAGYYWDAGMRLEDFLTPGGALHGKGAMWSSEAKPGARFTYANLGWGVLGTLMEKASGERFDLLMRRLVLDPLGMQGGFDAAGLAPERLANLATLYRKRSTADDAAWNSAGPWVETVATMLSIQWRDDGSNGETTFGSHRGRFNAWGLGNERFLDISGPGFGDRIVEGGGFVASGHIGEAYGLIGILAFDAASKDGIVYLIGGTGFDPDTDRGAYSAAFGFEERIATALYRRAILGRTD